MKTMLSEHFSYDELKCPCCGACNVDPRLLEAAEWLRAKLKKPLFVDRGGGFRCEKYNKSISGARDSRHMTGQALDLACIDSKSVFEMVQAAIELKVFGGIGVGDKDHFVHLDIRPLEVCRLWSY